MNLIYQKILIIINKYKNKYLTKIKAYCIILYD